MSSKVKPIIDRSKFIDLAKNVSKTNLFAKKLEETPIKVHRKLCSTLIYNNISLSKEKTKLANESLQKILRKKNNEKQKFSSKNSIDNDYNNNTIKTDANTENTFTTSSENFNKENSVNFHKINVNVLKKNSQRKNDISRNSSLLNDTQSESININDSRNNNLNESESEYRNKEMNLRYNHNNENKKNSNLSFRNVYLSRIQTYENENNKTSYRDLRKNIRNLFSSCPQIKKSESKEKTFTEGNNNIYNNNKNKVTIIKLEDLIVLEEKLYKILISFKNIKDVRKYIVDWWTFYNYTSFKGNFEYFFKENNQKIISHESSLLEFLSIIIVYEALGEGNINVNEIHKLQNLIFWVHQNYLIICDYILFTVSEVKGNILVNKLQNIVLSKITRKILNNENINLLKDGNHNIMVMIKNILKFFTQSETMNVNEITYYLKKSDETSINTLNEYFKKKINQNAYKNLHYNKIQTIQTSHYRTLSNPNIINPNLTSTYNNNNNKYTINTYNTMINKNNKNKYITNSNNNNIEKEQIPYLEKKKDKKKIFTLVLDLDETLISFHRDENGRGILKPRPYLNKFLTEMNKLYELIIFTAGTKEYADPILDIIDKKKEFFDQRLYRQHIIIKDDIFIKDLSKLGRDLSKIIILDNLPQNYDLQKENGIFIKNFYWDDKDDNALNELIPILKNIAKNPFNDVREELKKVKDEIFKKITTNLKE